MSLTILTGCHRNISAMHNLKKQCFPRRNWRCLSWGVRQKMTARHISLCEAKVPAAAPIFVSGERPPAHIQQLLSPNFVPKFVPDFTSRSAASTIFEAHYSHIKKAPTRQNRASGPESLQEAGFKYIVHHTASITQNCN